MNGASLPTNKLLEPDLGLAVLIPDEWGKSSDGKAVNLVQPKNCLNPR